MTTIFILCETCKKKIPKNRYWRRFCSSKCRGKWNSILRTKAVAAFRKSQVEEKS